LEQILAIHGQGRRFEMIVTTACDSNDLSTQLIDSDRDGVLELIILGGATVDEGVLRLGSTAGEGEVGLAAGVVADEDGRAREADNVHAAAIAGRHVFNGFGLDELADVGGAGIDGRGRRGYVDGLGDSADLQGEVEFEALAGGED